MEYPANLIGVGVLYERYDRDLNLNNTCTELTRYHRVTARSDTASISLKRNDSDLFERQFVEKISVKITRRSCLIDRRAERSILNAVAI